MPTFDLNILPIHRLNGQDLAELPGLLALTPPRKTARGREKDSLILYLMLAGNATFAATEIDTLNRKAATTFYQSAGPLTSAMRRAAESINAALLERNLSTTGRGLYALGFLALVVVREAQCTLLLNGPTHVIQVSDGKARHIHDPALSGKGLGSSQSIQSYLAQVDLRANDLLVVCGKFPRDWEADLLGERPNTSLEASYRKLTLTRGDLHAALIHSQNGPGIITVLHADVGSARQIKNIPASAPPAMASAETSDGGLATEDFFAATQHSLQKESQTQQPSISNEREAQPQAPAPVASDLSHNTLQENQPISASPTTITEEELDELADFAAHMIQPSAYAIPPQPPQESLPSTFQEEKLSSPPSSSAAGATPSAAASRSFPPSIPRAKPTEPPIEIAPEIEEEVMEEELDEEVFTEEEETFTPNRLSSLLAGWKRFSLFTRPKGEPAPRPSAHAQATRQMAKVMVGGIQSGRRVNERLGVFLSRFIPRLLPGVESRRKQQPMFFLPTYALVFIAIIIPVLVSVTGWVVFAKYGLNERYHELYQNALTTNAQASSETDPTRQRDELIKVIDYADKAIEYRETDEANLLRSEAQAKLDSLMGVVRLEFIPAFANGISNTTKISRIAASESDLYMLDAEKGSILHATFTGRSLELDTTFSCQPGMYAGYQVEALVDLLALPKINAVSATVLGIDATGQLLYCAPGQVPQAIPLPALPNTNWGRVTSFALDTGNLYVLDASARSIWVFVGKDSAFLDSPYFYFGNQIPNSIDNAIDLAVSGDDLYLLHEDGHLSTCTFSRIAETPTRCADPVNFQDPYPAHQDINLFAQADFTQLSLTAPPNSVILLLDSENRKVFRFTPRALELQNQVTGHAGQGNPFKPGPISAMTVSPNYVLYLAIDNQVYFATNLP